MQGLSIMTPTEQVERSEAIVSDLKGRVRGPLLLPGTPGFDEARAVWNAMIDRRPALVLRCLGVTDVIAGVNAARERGLPLSIKGGGHNIAGLAVCEGGLMLDMSLMRTYINFLTEEEGTERTLAAYRSNYERLVRVKAEWDPANLFRTNKNIDPAGERT